uniref:GIY-YIG domain-containing protein n=1 Tax=viral metagenome TaxID=1070528 RepID=A0A6C0DQY8_9ZZZZ
MSGVVKTEKPSFVYLLESSNGSTYVGATVDPDRRLRQHNHEITGGAHATGAKVARGEIWSRVCYISGFPSWSAALQFEWRFKQISRKLPKNMIPFQRRMMALKTLLQLERPTTKAVAYSEWPSPPEIIWENEDAKDYFYSISNL